MAHFTEGPWYVYLVRCNDDSLYTGVTTDVTRRFQEHQAQGKKTAKYLRGKQPLSLVYVVAVESKRKALQLEHTIKEMAKCKKEAMLCLCDCYSKYVKG